VQDGGGNVETGGSCGFLDPESLRNASVRLGPLSDGVHPLLGGSAGIDDARASSCLPEDQRGVQRNAAECDAGAFEALKTDLRLTLAAAPGAVTAGEQVTLTATVSNHGPRQTGGVFTTLLLPGGSSFVSGSAGCAAGPPVVCTTGALSPDGSAPATVVVRADTAGTATYTAAVLGDLAELSPGDESASATVTVAPVASGPGPSADTTPPRLTLALVAQQRARKAARQRRLRVRLATTEPCTGEASVHSGARRLARVRGRAFPVGATRITFRLSKTAARRMRKARRLSLRATCTDPSGNRGTLQRSVKIRR
jgi:uncharacterized repeat protein (TIGR01451 family)